MCRPLIIVIIVLHLTIEVRSAEVWIPVNDGLTSLTVEALAVTPTGAILAGTDGGGIFRSADQGETWQSANQGVDFPHISGIVVDSNGTVMAGSKSQYPYNTGPGLFRSKDDGLSWSHANNGLTTAPIHTLYHHPISGWFASTDQVLDPYAEPFVYHSTDGGDHWSTLCYGTYFSMLWVNDHLLFGFSVNANSGDVMIVSNLENPTFNMAEFDEFDFYSSPLFIREPKSGYLLLGAGTDYTGALYESTDEGFHWTRLPTSRFSLARSDAVFDFDFGPGGDWFICAGAAGIYRSKDEGQAWTAYNDGLTPLNHPTRTLTSTADGTLFVGTEGGGVFRLRAEFSRAEGEWSLYR